MVTIISPFPPLPSDQSNAVGSKSEGSIKKKALHVNEKTGFNNDLKNYTILPIKSDR
jgi:hypothetical protein